jgi:hypothetical protein
MSSDIIVLILGILSSITLVTSALSVHRHRLLVFSVATGVIVALQYGIVGAYAGLIITLIGTFRTLLAVLGEKFHWLEHWLMIPVFLALHTTAFFLVSDLSNSTLITFIPLIGGWGSTIVMTLKNVIHMKVMFIVLGGMWLAYELSNMMYSQMVGESLNLIANIAALTTLLIARCKGIPESELEDVDTQIINVITTGIHLPQHKNVVNVKTKPIPTLNNTKIVSGAHPNSVAYGKLIGEYNRK